MSNKVDDALRERAREWREKELGDICDKGYFTIANIDFEYNLAAFAASELSRGQGLGPRCPRCGSGDLVLWRKVTIIYDVSCNKCSSGFCIGTPDDLAQFFRPVDVDALAEEISALVYKTAATKTANMIQIYPSDVRQYARDVLRRSLGGEENNNKL